MHVCIIERKRADTLPSSSPSPDGWHRSLLWKSHLAREREESLGPRLSSAVLSSSVFPAPNACCWNDKLLNKSGFLRRAWHRQQQTEMAATRSALLFRVFSLTSLLFLGLTRSWCQRGLTSECFVSLWGFWSWELWHSAARPRPALRFFSHEHRQHFLFPQFYCSIIN